MIQLTLEIAAGLAGYCFCMWLLVFLAVGHAHRRYRRRNGGDYYGGSGELGLLVLAPLLPLLLLLQLFDR